MSTAERQREIAGQRQKAWHAMRRRRRFDLADLQVIAEISYYHAKLYVRALELAGYLHRERGSNNQGGAVWSLALDSGPRAPEPRLRRHGHFTQLFDPNTRTRTTIAAGGRPAGDGGNDEQDQQES